MQFLQSNISRVIVFGLFVQGGASLSIQAQSARTADAEASSSIPSEGTAQTAASNAGELMKEIDDPHTGDRWLLMRDIRHLGGPGLMVVAAQGRTPGQTAAPGESPAPIIRSGDPVIVEQNTSTMDAHLEALAMTPATAGSCFDARLRIGCGVVRAVAIAPGRAVFKEEVRR